MKKHIIAFILFLYNILEKFALMHSYIVWYNPEAFVAFTTYAASLISGNPLIWLILILLLVNLYLISVMLEEKKKKKEKKRNADTAKSGTRSARHRHF